MCLISAIRINRKEDIVGYQELENLRIGPCNFCMESNNECIRSRKVTKGGLIELGRCIPCKIHHHSCVWGPGGNIRFRPRTTAKPPTGRLVMKIKLAGGASAAAKKPKARLVPHRNNKKPDMDSSKKPAVDINKRPAVGIEDVERKLMEMHKTTMEALLDLTHRVVALEARHGS